jgi:1,4-alpha-glucan branching enzyme
VWLNPENAWTWPHIYAAEEQMKRLAQDPAWRSTPEAQRLAKQICRELLLLESSDWQFLITTGTARDYAEQRFNTHLDAFNQLFAIWRCVRETRDLSQDQLLQLTDLEPRDSLFPEISPEMWM